MPSALSDSYKRRYGIIDYGDVCRSAYIFDLATSVGFFMISANVEDFVEYSRHLIAGYNHSRKLSDQECDVLYLSVCASISRELLLCEYHYQLQSGDNEYLLTSSATGWDVLIKLWSMTKDMVMTKWNYVNSE